MERNGNGKEWKWKRNGEGKAFFPEKDGFKICLSKRICRGELVFRNAASQLWPRWRLGEHQAPGQHLREGFKIPLREGLKNISGRVSKTTQGGFKKHLRDGLTNLFCGLLKWCVCLIPQSLFHLCPPRNTHTSHTRQHTVCTK